VIYKKYSDKNQAIELIELLQGFNIEALLEEDAFSVDLTRSNNAANKDYIVKLKTGDFTKADEILMQIAAQEISNVDDDYYLFGFTDDELIKILSKPDEWGEFDCLLAQKILKERGKEINPEILKLLRKNRIEGLSKREVSPANWIILGYISVVFGGMLGIFLGYIPAVSGGLLGIFLGYYLYAQKRTLPDGKRVYLFSDTDRKRGRNLFIVGVICLILWIIYNLFTHI
jgi:hypothetical protein